MEKHVNKLIRKIYDFKGFPLLAAGVLTLFLLEKRYPLRKLKGPLFERLVTNSVIASTAALGMRLTLIPLITQAAHAAESKGYGLLPKLPLPKLLKNLLGLLILDYGSYTWHKLNHAIPGLWRFHQVHHADLDLDLTTGLRFHLGEVLISVIYRGAWAFLSGVSPRLVLIYEVIFEGATNFHHTNLRLPEKVDTGLAQVIVTPRMHGIHHSVIRNETDSNYSVVFNIWDKLHKTFRLDIPQEEINIGVPYVRTHKGAKELFIMPFKENPAWKFPDGKVPMRISLAGNN